jgi:hypothetical protein
MISRLSNFVGPLGSFFSGGILQPNLLLSLDSFNYDLYGKSFTFDSDNSSGVTYSSDSVTSDGGGGWATYTRSNESYETSVKLKFQKGPVSGALMCGLSNLSDGGTYTNINFGFYLQSDNLVTIVENQTNSPDPFYEIYQISGTFSTSTIYSIVFDGIRVRYYIDDVLEYTSYTSPMVTPLYLFATFLNNPGISLTNIEFGSFSPVWNDASGNDRNFTLVSAPRYANNSFKFDRGFGQYATGNDLGTLNQFTVDTWFKLNSQPDIDTYPQIVENTYDGNSSFRNFAIGFINYPWDGKILGGFFNTDEWKYTDGFVPELNTWYNVTLTYDQQHLNLYLDGALYSSVTYSTPALSSGLGINIGNNFFLEFIDGQIDVVKIWDSAISLQQISQNYNNINQRYILSNASIVLTGTSSIDVPRGGDFVLATSYTIEFWSKAATNSNVNIFTVMSQRDSQSSIDIFYQGGNLVIRNGVTVTAEPPPGVWTHVAIVSDNTALSVYYNGLSQSVSGNGGNLQDDIYPLSIGCRGSYNNFQYFDGSLYGIRINNTVVYTTDFDPYEVAFPPENIDGTVLLVKEYQVSTGNFIDSSYNTSLVNNGVTHSTDLPSVYRYLRWAMTQTKGADNVGFGAIQACELVLLYNGATVSWGLSASATNPDGANVPSETASKLIDYTIGTKWCDNTYGTTSFGTSTIYIDNVSPIFFNSYYYVTGNDSPNRDPVTWTLSGSNDNSTWTIINTQSNVTITDNRQASTQIFNIS